MAEHPRNPKNAAGPFYVLKGQCISCGAPPAEAPGLVTLDDDDDGGGCYFHKQPETPSETNDAIRALWVSCIAAYRYGGTDPTIRRRLAELGYSQQCDHPLEGHPVVLRNHVRFALADHDDATEVANLLLASFGATFRDGRCTRAVTGDAHRSTFEYNSSARNGTPRCYTVERLPPASTGRASAYREPSTASAWLLAEDGSAYPPIWLHDVLHTSGAVAIRWFSAKEWAEGAWGEALPY